MKVHGTVTRVVDGKLFFKPADPMVFRRIATGSLTASGEIVVDVDPDKTHEVGEEGDYEVGGDEEQPVDPPPELPPPAKTELPPEEGKAV